MEKEVFEEQTRKLGILWHQIIRQENSMEAEKQFPNLAKLTTNEISILHMAAENPEVKLKDIATALTLPKSTLTHTIDRLEKNGYLCRTLSKQDRRSFGLQLTKQGEKAQQEHIQYEKKLFGRILKVLDEQESEELIRLLTKLLEGEA